MNKTVSRDAVSAWTTLCTLGGLEPDGRDADLAAALKTALTPSAATLDDALRASSTDDFVRAFFDLVQPFAHMFRAIMDFFEAAGAREGQNAWVIQIDETHLDLMDFQAFVESWDSLPSELEVPAIDSSGAWTVFEAARNLSGVEPTRPAGESGPPDTTGTLDVDQWLKGYGQGQYFPFPPSLHPMRVVAELADAAAVTMASVNIIRRAWPDRAAMLAEYRAGQHTTDDGDGFSLRTVAQHETDHRVALSIVCLARASQNETQRATFGQTLKEIYGRYPRRKMGIRAEQALLERILSLPLWQRRHALYAVWIATEIVNAVPDHRCELHHQGGRITFAFREAVVATVHTTRPKVRLYAERRSPLQAPLGPTRKANVQPDYGLWRGNAPSETCQLVIEVKHHKRGSPARFGDVLTDYARAHPQAHVLLVCHGPANESLHRVASEVRNRCSVISELTPSHLDRRERFRKVVRNCVGDPVSRNLNREFDPDTIVAIDHPALTSAALGPDGFPQLPTQERLAMVSLMMAHRRVEEILQMHLTTQQVRYVHPRDDAGRPRLPVLDLLTKHDRIILVTDSAGLVSLANTTFELIHSERVGASELLFVEVRR